jgi:hypothetical protein
MFKSIFKAVAVAAVFSIGCSDGDGGNTTGPDVAREAKTYTGTAEGVTYTLKIEDGGPRAALTPTSGDKFTLTQNADSKKSTGTVTKAVGGVLTLAPKEGPDDEFTATVSGDNITAMSGNITWDDGTADEAPETLTPSGGIDPGPGPGPNPGIDSSWKWTAVADSTIWNNALGTSIIPSHINAIAYGNNRFVAGGDYGKMAYSDDGESWTAVPNNTFSLNSSIEAIAYGNNRFVVGGSSGKMAYSDDNGESCTAVPNNTLSLNSSIEAIAYGNNRFVAVSYNGKMAYSDDGINWTAVSDSKFPSTNSEGESFWINAIAYGSNRFVAGGDNGKMAYSADGASWTAVSDSKFPSTDSYGPFAIGAIAYGNGRFVAGGRGKMAYSSDGINWTAVTDSRFDYSSIYAIAYGNNRFVAGPSSIVTYSDNGASWTAILPVTEISTIYAIAYGNNRFVAGGWAGKMAYADW